MDATTRIEIQSPKKSGLVAQHIVNEIISQGMGPGQSLPPEAEMCTRYGVGRSTVREALRLLESQGILTIKTGPGGGPILAAFDAGFLAANLAVHLRISGATLRDVMNARLVIEPAIAGAAAEHRDDATVEALEASVRQSQNAGVDGAAFVRDGASFHDIVATGSGNPFFEYLLLALRRITEPFAQRLPYSCDRRERLISDHEKIVEAIASGDRDGAIAAMRADLLEFIDYAEQAAPQLLDQRVEWGQLSQ